MSFVAADSTNNQLGTVLTCGHLTIGTVPDSKGRFYPRCALGDSHARQRWLLRVGAGRLEKVRALQAEFDAFSRPFREQLFAAKAKVAASPGSIAHRRTLDRLMANFLDAVQTFLEAREERFDEVDLPIGPLTDLIRDWSLAWAASRDLANDRFSEDPLLPFAAGPVTKVAAIRAPGADGRKVEPPMQTSAKAAPSTPIYADASLVITRTLEPPGLSFEGEIDASNAPAVAQALSIARVVPGDFYLDMRALRFCDLDAFRAMVQTAGQLGAGRRLVVEGLPAYLWRAMRIVGWADLPNLVVNPLAAAEMGVPT